jgi:type I restriction enzyme M protein
LGVGLSERITENIVRDALRRLDYYSQSLPIRVEEQKSEIQSVKRLLKTASKTGLGNPGAPEFIITSSDTPDFIVIIECKASVDRHKSKDLQDPIHFAIDGALHYASFLSKEYNVIAVAVSGQRSECNANKY